MKSSTRLGLFLALCLPFAGALAAIAMARGGGHNAPQASMRKQKLLLLYSADSSLTSSIVAWSLYDGTGAYDFDASDASEDVAPPYPSVLDAMRDAWRVIQLPVLQSVDPGSERRLGYLRFETVLEKLEECS